MAAIQEGACGRAKDPRRHLLPSSLPCLPFAGFQQRREGVCELVAHIDTPSLMGFGGADPALTEVAADLDEAAMPVDVFPLECECFPEPDSRTSQREEERIVSRKVFL